MTIKDKHQDLLSLLDEAKAASMISPEPEYHRQGNNIPYQEWRDRLIPYSTKVVKFINDHSALPEYTDAEYDECAIMLRKNKEELEDMIRSTPTPISDSLLPIAVCKLMLWVYGIPAHSQSPEWGHFNKHYGKLITRIRKKLT